MLNETKMNKPSNESILWRNRKIQLEIAKIKNDYPSDVIITDYKSFLQERDFLKHYKYNPLVFDALVKLTCDLWCTTKRINRFDLITAIKMYGKKRIEKNDVSDKTKEYLFELFKQLVILKNIKVLQARVIEYQKRINSAILGMGFNETIIKELCANAHTSNFVLSRLLRYPTKNKIISSWVVENFKNPVLSARRAEALSWVIDVDPTFILNKNILWFDFANLNIADKKKIEEFENDKRLCEIINKEMHGIVNIELADDNDREFYTPSLHTQRFYAMPQINGKYAMLPDFESLEKEFNENINMYYAMTMIWGITYSRIALIEKEKLLPKYFSEEVYGTFFNVSVKLGSLGLLRFMKGDT